MTALQIIAYTMQYYVLFVNEFIIMKELETKNTTEMINEGTQDFVC